MLLLAPGSATSSPARSKVLSHQPEETPVNPSCETTSADDPAPNPRQVQIPECQVIRNNNNDDDDDDPMEGSETNVDQLHFVNANAVVSAAIPDFQQQQDVQSGKKESTSSRKSSSPSTCAQQQQPQQKVDAQESQSQSQHLSQPPSPLECHYPVPTYPQGYIYAPQHGAYYAVDVVAFASNPSHLLASFGNNAGAVS